MKTGSAPTALVILDGFGYRDAKNYNAIYQAHTPHYDNWMHNFPHAILCASGPCVGLLSHMMGNSEVGHLTIGLGRIVKSAVTIINDAIKDDSFFSNPLLLQTLRTLPKHNTLHLMGLLSDAGVHADLHELYAFLKVAKQEGIKNVFIHPFLDGRDTPPKSAAQYLQLLEAKIQEIGIGKIGSIHGRFYAMDRDKNWDRTEQSYRTLTEPAKIRYHSWPDALEQYYAKDLTDEFIPPTLLVPNAYLHTEDGIIFLNFRPDRARQITASFVDPAFHEFRRPPVHLSFFITPTVYDTKLHTTALYQEEHRKNSLKDILAQHHKTIFSIAETEKYAHVTYFFDGGKEEIKPNETRVLIPSLHKKQYADHPAMSAPTITEKVIRSLQTNPADFYLINYANADMVGHSGNFQATTKAIECLDEQLGVLFDQIVNKMEGTMYVTGDHGNAEDMYDEQTHQPRTSHTTNPVPFIMLRASLKDKDEPLPLKELSDIAPFVLTHMGIPAPQEMQD